jgi:hypothetical protein
MGYCAVHYFADYYIYLKLGTVINDFALFAEYCVSWLPTQQTLKINQPNITIFALVLFTDTYLHVLIYIWIIIRYITHY